MSTEDRYAAERERAREQLRRSVDTLAEKTSLHLKLQRDPLKIVGGVAGGALILGTLLGRRGRKVKKVYVERAGSGPAKAAAVAAHGSKAQVAEQVGKQTVRATTRGTLQGALVATLSTVLLRVLQEKVLAPNIERYADQLLARADQARQGKKQGAATTVIPPQK
ncbi:hypothetical protein HNR42_001930 [Deinobacterium chartae]|uniref:DUF3618 domain-containing protein n=1 Tax=Deinobacterium chartae TaxID=521158 RepID=A0A841I055_9DEIO|nr:hypothetical protein [Deinobacterium chartae]MBB6098496.1 hypothetical protein [Deinobacterium chartae]